MELILVKHRSDTRTHDECISILHLQSKGVTALTHRAFLIGLDVGGTKVEGILVDGTKSQVDTCRVAMDTTSVQRVVESIAEAIQALLDSAHLSKADLAGIGIGIPGQVLDGVVHLAVNLKMEHYPLAERLSRQFGAPVRVENDVRIAALGVYERLFPAREVRHLAYVSVGTGISAGVILDGRLHRGAGGMAGEIGHVQLDPLGPVCGCGARGCLEAFASGSGIVSAARQALEQGQKSALGRLYPGEITTQAVFAAAAEGDALALQIVETAARYLSQAVQWLVMGYDVERVVLGGGVLRSRDVMAPALLRNIQRLRESSALASHMLPEEKIVLLPEDFNPGVWGAVRLAWRV
jgi:glucokinase